MNKIALLTNFDDTIKKCESWEEALSLVMTLTKKEMLKIQDNIADFEGHNWKKEEGAKLLISGYKFRVLGEVRTI